MGAPEPAPYMQQYCAVGPQWWVHSDRNNRGFTLRKFKRGHNGKTNHSSMNQGRRWCFTIHLQDGDNQYDLQLQTIRSFNKFRGLACQLEVCPETSRHHLQGYVEFGSPVRMAALKKLHRTAHWEMAKGSRKQCVDYCNKEESVHGGDTPVFRVCDTILGEDSTQGRRSDLLECARLISSGEWSRKEVHEERPDLILKFSKGVNELLRYREQSGAELRRDLDVIVIWGLSGTGKTRYAFGDGSDVFILENSNSNAVWWDGYNGESTLIIDDFYGWIPHHQLLRFLDIYPVRLDIKGGSTYAKWTRVFITSNKKPQEWYHKFDWHCDTALQRRIKTIWEANGPIWKNDKDEEKEVLFDIL